MHHKCMHETNLSVCIQVWECVHPWAHAKAREEHWLSCSIIFYLMPLRQVLPEPGARLAAGKTKLPPVSITTSTALLPWAMLIVLLCYSHAQRFTKIWVLGIQTHILLNVQQGARYSLSHLTSSRGILIMSWGWAQREEHVHSEWLSCRILEEAYPEEVDSQGMQPRHSHWEGERKGIAVYTSQSSMF